MDTYNIIISLLIMAWCSIGFFHYLQFRRDVPRKEEGLLDDTVTFLFVCATGPVWMVVTMIRVRRFRQKQKKRDKE